MVDDGLFSYAFPMLVGQWFARWLLAEAGPLPTCLQRAELQRGGIN